MFTIIGFICLYMFFGYCSLIATYRLLNDEWPPSKEDFYRFMNEGKSGTVLVMVCWPVAAIAYVIYRFIKTLFSVFTFFIFGFKKRKNSV